MQLPLIPSDAVVELKIPKWHYYFFHLPEMNEKTAGPDRDLQLYSYIVSGSSLLSKPIANRKQVLRGKF